LPRVAFPALEEQITTEKLDSSTDKRGNSSTEEEFVCPPVEDFPVEEEALTSGPEPLFPLSLSQAGKIRVTAAIPNNVARRFAFCSLP